MKNLAAIMATALAACSSQGASMSQDCTYFDVFGDGVTDTHFAFRDPEGDADRLFGTNGKYNVIFSLEDGVGKISFLHDDIITGDVSGDMRFEDAELGEKLRRVSNAAGKKVDANVIAITAGLRNEVSLPSLLGQRVNIDGKCYQDEELQSYIRRFNSKSLNLIYERIK